MSDSPLNSKRRGAPVAAPAQAAGGFVTTHVTRVNGFDVHTRVAGDGAPVVLMHGLLGTAAGWEPVMKQLAPVRRVYALDALGIGRSDRVAGLDAGLEASAHRLAVWMDAEGLDSVDLVGTSHGGAVSMYFAALFPKRVRRLLLHAPANPFCVRSRPQIDFACTHFGALVARLIPSAPGALHSVALRRMYGDPARIRPGALDEYVQSLRVPGTVDYVLGVLRSWHADMAALAGLLDKLRAVRTLLLWGQLDRAVSLESARMLQQALGAPLVLLPALGHLPFEEAPDTFAMAALRLLSPERQPGAVQRTA